MPLDLAPNNPYGLELRVPVVAAAGCLGYGIEYERMLDLTQLGAIVTRSTSLEPQRGSRQQRMVETPAGLVWSSSWANPGLRVVLERYAPLWAGWKTPVILSVIGASAADYADVAAALEGVEGIAALELNLAEQTERAARITAATRAATQLPLLAKLPALETAALAELALAIAAAGADALTIGVPPRGLHLDPRSGERTEGYLCGPALRPLTLQRIAAVTAAVQVPVLACGGIASSADARQFLAAGAHAVQLGTALLTDPFAAGRVAHQLVE